MRERVLAIVNLIAQYFLDEQDAKSETELVEELLAVGFEAEEINAAFSWMETEALRPSQTNDLAASVVTHRILTPEEQRTFSLEASGFLLRLRSLGILDEDLFEEIVHKAVEMAEDEVSLKEVKTITVLALFARSQNQWRQEFDCLLEDDWTRLLN